MSLDAENTMSIFAQISWASAGKFIAAFINLAALIIYSRLLGPAEFGVLVLAQSIAFVGYNIFYMWAEKSIIRFALPSGDRFSIFLGGLIAGYAMISLILVAVFIFADFIWPINWLNWVPTLLLPIFLTMLFEALCTAVMDIQVAFSRMGKYAFLISARALFTLAVAVTFTQVWSVTPYDVLMGHAVGCALVFVIGCLIGNLKAPVFAEWKDECRKMFVFGYPLSASMVFRILIQRMDRFVIGTFLGTEAVGIYSIAFDFARRALGVPLMVVNLVFYPLMVKAQYEKKNENLNQLLIRNWLGLIIIGP